MNPWVIRQGAPSPAPRPKRQSPYLDLILQARALKPDQHIPFPLPAEVLKSREAVSRRLDSLSSLMRRHVRPHHKHRILVLRTSEGLAIWCRKRSRTT